MSFSAQLITFVVFCLIRADLLEATTSYQCGIRKHSFVQLVHDGWTIEEGQWPWHVALFHREQSGAATKKYACGGSLLNEKHVLTAAHCVVNRNHGYPLKAAQIELHFGQLNLSSISANVQVRDVSKVVVHPEFSTHKNDIAMVVMRLPVQYTDFVIPICIDQRADRDLRNLQGQRGWIAGWGTTEVGGISEVLRTASLPVVSYLQCFTDDQLLFGNILNSNVFCAGDRNGTSPGTGDSGGGMFFSDGDRWVLRGIVSFAKANELKKEVDTSKFAVFVNVQQFLTWIKEVMAENEPQAASEPMRISERECERFKLLTRKRSNGICDNSRYPHTVSLIFADELEGKCSGILVNENHVVTACHCKSHPDRRAPTKIQIDAYGFVEVSEMICHPEYKRTTVYHDLAVLKLKTSVSLSSNIIPACLANNQTENLYDTLLQTGFGISMSGIKKFIETDENRVISKEKCDQLLPSTSRFPIGTIPGQLCVVNDDRLHTAPQGSSGGPLQSVNSRSCMYTVVGVTSTGNSAVEGIRESNGTVFTIYSRVAYYLDWIEEVVWNVQSSVQSPAATVKVGERPSNRTQSDFVFPDD